jgi:hypothetical protein
VGPRQPSAVTGALIDGNDLDLLEADLQLVQRIFSGALQASPLIDSFHVATSISGITAR